MSKAIKILAIAIPAVIATGVGAIYVQYVGSTEELVRLYPQFDPMVVRKVSAEMFRESLSGKYSDIIDNEEMIEQIFMGKAMHYSSN